MKKALSILFAGILLLSSVACSSNNTPTSSGTASSSQVSSQSQAPEIEVSEEKEAPILAAQVAEGKLPPLEERIPSAADVMVEPDIMSLGQYGGSAVITIADSARWSRGLYGEQSMFRFKQDGSGTVEANVCKEFYSNEDSTVWTIKLREGMKWSDGAPFTADDIIFYYDHMSTPALKEDRTAVSSEDEGFYSAYTSKPYNCYQAIKDGVKYWAEFKKVNDYEFTVTFVAPKPSFAEDVAVDNKWMFLPKHFYINYVARKDGVADDPTFPLITEEQAVTNANKDFGKDWDSYGTMSRDIGYYHWDYYIVPQIRTFIAVKDNWNSVGETYTMVRNPYFWKTDSEGRQLPYIDSMDFKIINEQDQITLQAMSGSLDIYHANVDFATVAPAVKDTHSIKVWNTADWAAGDTSIGLNQTVKDLDKRALFQDARFREALSICVDRNLLNETLLNGMSEPRQASPAEGNLGSNEEWAKKWTEFDVEKANKLMDEITEPWDGASGTYRKMLGTNKDVEIIVSRKEASIGANFLTLLKSAYATIGVKLSEKVDPEFRLKILSNDVEASMEMISASTPALRADSLVPLRNVDVWHSAYGKWYEDGKTEANGGIAPTGDVLALVEAYEKMKAANGSDRDSVVAECVQEIYDLHHKNIWVIAYLAPVSRRYVVNNRLQNFGEGYIMVDEFRLENISRPEQWWIAE